MCQTALLVWWMLIAFSGWLGIGQDPWSGDVGGGFPVGPARLPVSKIPTDPPTFDTVSAVAGETSYNMFCTTSRAARVRFRWVAQAGGCTHSYVWPWVEGDYTIETGTEQGKQIGPLTHTTCYRVQIYIDAVIGPDLDWTLFEGDGEDGDYQTLVRDAGDPPDPET